MKKLFFIMAMSVCAFTAQAQTTSGIRVGLNMTSATGKYNDLMADQDYNNKSYMGYSIHYFIDVPVIGNFSIQPAVGLSMKGITYEYDKFTTKKSHRLDLDSYKKYDVTESRGTSVTQKQAFPINAALYGNSPIKTVNITFRIVRIIILAKGGTIIFGYGMFIFSIFVGGYCQIFIRLIFKLTKQPIREVRPHSQLNPKRF